MLRSIATAFTLAFIFSPVPLSAQDNTVFTLSGDALNVSVGVSDTVAMVITDKGDNELHATGTFANNTLFGSFRANGAAADHCAPKHFCLHFDGVLENLQGGGFDADTVTSFTMTLTMSQDAKTAQGTYRTGVLPSYRRDQYGSMTLNAPKN